MVTAWPVNHLQSAFFLCSLLDASRLGPSLWGASKHSEELKNHVEVLWLMFGNFAECDPGTVAYLLLRVAENLTLTKRQLSQINTIRTCTQTTTLFLEVAANNLLKKYDSTYFTCFEPLSVRISYTNNIL